MLSIQIDESVVEKQFREEVQKKMKQLDRSRLLWDLKELCRQTSMSEPFIKEHFFYDERFPKVKVGRKWVIPAKAAEEFLLTWLSEKSNHWKEKGNDSA